MSWDLIKKLIKENADKIIEENEGPKILDAGNINDYSYRSKYHAKEVERELKEDVGYNDHGPCKAWTIIIHEKYCPERDDLFTQEEY